MEVTMQEIFNFTITYKDISNEKMDLFLSYQFAKLNKICIEEQEFYKDQCKKYLNEYGVKDETGNFISDKEGVLIQKEKIPEFNEKMSQLNNLKININFNGFILKDLDGLKLSPLQVENILPFILNED